MTIDRRLAEHLRQMSQAAAEAIAFAEDMTEAEFLTDLRTQRAIVMSLMLVGEAAARILSDHPDFAVEYPAVPWRAIRSMRNRIIHGYFDINLHVVWRTVAAELPWVIEQLRQLPDRPAIP